VSFFLTDRIPSACLAPVRGFGPVVIHDRLPPRPYHVIPEIDPSGGYFTKVEQNYCSATSFDHQSLGTVVKNANGCFPPLFLGDAAVVALIARTKIIVADFRSGFF